MRPDDVGEIASLCDFVSFNSLSQYQMHGEGINRAASCGLRVNPQMSFVDDERYDPCRPNSKLGVPLELLVEVLKREPHRLSGIDGILVHSNCDSSDLAQAQATVQYMHPKLCGLFERVQWVNLGGGYLFDETESLQPLCETIDLLRSSYGLEVFVEPGAALARAAGQIVSTVLDVFESGSKEVAVLDTTVNHMPEAFEYGFEPDVLGHDDDADHEVSPGRMHMPGRRPVRPLPVPRALRGRVEGCIQQYRSIYTSQSPHLQRRQPPGDLLRVRVG